MADSGCEHQDLSAVALFPLPNVVLFPRAILPLHIFEERYKAMTADAVDRDGRMAMALLRPGWEKCYYSRPTIEPVVCVGQILQHERLPDGTYNFLLQGCTRAKLVSEEPPGDRLYRVAKLEPLTSSTPLEIDLSQHRDHLNELFSAGAMARACLGKQFRQMLAGTWPTQDIADVAAFYLLDDLPLKQSLLGECDVISRVERTVHALQEIASKMRATNYVPPAAVDYTLKHPDMN
ncbi:MAG: LON peptidase substrate-binding domain-containing protein [Anaerolineae bacterium]|nr:LON peptidase substrate-binding domain-containing protein [Phycisphaerae bacterium]